MWKVAWKDNVFVQKCDTRPWTHRTIICNFGADFCVGTFTFLCFEPRGLKQALRVDGALNV